MMYISIEINLQTILLCSNLRFYAPFTFNDYKDFFSAGKQIKQ